MHWWSRRGTPSPRVRNSAYLSICAFFIFALSAVAKLTAVWTWSALLAQDSIRTRAEPMGASHSSHYRRSAYGNKKTSTRHLGSEARSAFVGFNLVWYTQSCQTALTKDLLVFKIICEDSVGQGCCGSPRSAALLWCGGQDRTGAKGPWVSLFKQRQRTSRRDGSSVRVSSLRWPDFSRWTARDDFAT